MTTVFRVIEVPAEEKSAALFRGVAEANESTQPHGGPRCVVFERSSESFSAIPGSPFSYWAGITTRSTFSKKARFDDRYVAARGAYTTDDFRFYRLAWEVPIGRRGKTREDTSVGYPYVALAKGGSYSPYYSDVHLVIRWSCDGAEAKAFLSAYRERKGWGTDWSACLNGYTHYFRPGLTWPRRTQSGLGLRVMPGGCVFADKGPAVFTRGDASQDLLALLAVMTSSTFRYLVELQMAFGSYEVGVIQRTPVPDVGANLAQLALLACRGWSLKRRLDSVNETSHAFLLPPGLSDRIASLDRQDVEREIRHVQYQIDDHAFSLYGIASEDRIAIESGFGQDTVSAITERMDTDEDALDTDEEEDLGRNHVAPMWSWFVGVSFGRFDSRLATSERPIPPEPEPFDSLPERSAGMWPEGEEPPVSPPDILVDDPGHARDLTTHVSDVAAALDVSEPDDLRAWLARVFFPLHIKMYSKSRRKAPIYWQLATSSASYSVWLYIHAFTRDTLFRVQNDYVAPKLEHEQRRLETMLSEFGERATAVERRAVAAQEVFVGELRDFLDEVKRVAPLWSPNLDDGVIVNFAPVWRLVPQHKPWQRELKATWDALCEGKYDWTHLAMHLWPERVVPKCATDRSLAIAHDLEEVFWEQGVNGKWSERPTSTVPVDELVRGRTSAAIKSALQNLLNAPIANGRGRRRRGTAGTGNGGGC